MKLLLVVFSALTLSLGGCKKEEKPAAAPPVSTPAPAATPAADVDPNADYIRILATHVVRKPTDPVVVSLTNFQVVKADFDPQKVEGGTAVLEIDLTSLESGSAKRDKHLRSPDYLDVTQFAKATVTIDDVKKTADNTYSAQATVQIRGKEQKLPVSFTVLDRTADAIRIKGEHTFSRHAFEIGAPEGGEDTVASDLTIELQMTLKKTS